jgi:uncharacterized protein (TIGR02453 family)
VSAVFPGFPTEMVQFFKKLKRNNRREWFQPRKHLFDRHVKAPMMELVTAINAQMIKFAPSFVTDPKKALFRIYRDTRFAADKTPYKTHIAASFSRRAPEHLGSGGFYFSVSDTEIEVAGGIYHPTPETILAVRMHIADHHKELREILAAKDVRRLLGDLQGAELTRAPKGFDPAHPAVDLIKKKDWILDINLDAGLSTTTKLQGEIVDRFRAMAPFIEFMNRAVPARKPANDLLEYCL